MKEIKEEQLKGKKATSRTDGGNDFISNKFDDYEKDKKEKEDFWKTA